MAHSVAVCGFCPGNLADLSLLDSTCLTIVNARYIASIAAKGHGCQYCGAAEKIQLPSVYQSTRARVAHRALKESHVMSPIALVKKSRVYQSPVRDAYSRIQHTAYTRSRTFS